MDHKLEIFTLGGVRILRDGKLIKGLANRKAEALLIYLASTRRSQPREVLADLLWDERTQSQALANLRVVLTALRQALGENVNISRDAVSINPATPIWLDAAQLEGSLQELHCQGRLCAGMAGQAAEAVALYQGEFLEGFSLLNCRRFDDWQVRERVRLHHLAVDGLSELVAYYIEVGEYQTGLVHAAKLLELDPLMESAHRQMMMILASCGHRSAALDQYATCQNLLQAELGVDPGKETKDLFEQIHAGKFVDIHQSPSFSLQCILDTRINNLPLQLTSFIGREKETADVLRLINTSRLVTLIGCGGVGKTRLALEIGSQLLPDYHHGIWLVELAALADPQCILPAIASVFKLSEIPGQQLLDTLLDFLNKMKLLLLLDSCEHLIDSCASLCELILKNAPQVHILVTSREALGIPGEHIFFVPSLSLPDSESTHDPGIMAHSESVRMFVDRSAQAMPGFTLSAENAAAIAQICVKLDGIPLALELAAIRVKHLKVSQIAEHLEDALSLLTCGSRTALPRQKSLYATIDWSYNLLTEPERILFNSLSLFEGAWDLAAAESLCRDKGKPQPPDLSLQADNVLDLLSGLVSKSMVLLDRQPGTNARYRMLEIYRQYAMKKLQDTHELSLRRAQFSTVRL